MKKFFLFVFGTFGVVMAAAVCYFVFLLVMPARQQPGSTTGSPSTGVAGLTSTVAPDYAMLQIQPGQPQPPPNVQNIAPKTIALDLTLHIPPALEGVLTPESTMRGIVRDGDAPRDLKTRFADILPSEGSRESAPTPKFPKKLRFYADKVQFVGAIGPSRKMLAILDLCLGPQKEACLPTTTPRISALILRTVKEEELASGLIEVGDVFFLNHSAIGAMPFSNPPACRTENVTGKITPTKDFLDRVPKDKKVAVFFTGAMINSRMAEKARKKEPLDPWPFIYYADFISPSPQGASYTFPITKMNSIEGLTGFAAICDPAETLQACAKKHFPGVQPGTPDGTGFRLVGEGLRFFPCTAAGPFNYILHWFPTVTDQSKPASGKSRNPALPPEIVEGQLFP